MEKYLENVLQATWLVGLQCDSHHVGPSASGLACIRLQVAGVIHFTLLDFSRFVTSLRIVHGKEQWSMTEILDAAKALNQADTPQAFIGHQCGNSYVHIKQLLLKTIAKHKSFLESTQ
eukprot:1381694-Amphidinium_carterae.1